MYDRILARRLRVLAQQFRTVFLTGPRQLGKTTLAREQFRDHDYVSLEDPGTRDLALGDPKGFLHRFRGPAIIDEVQRAP